MPNLFYNEIDGDTVAAEAVMLRAAKISCIMLVEGASDERLFVHFTDQDHCDIVVCHGRENALDALGILESRSVAGVLCVIDADFSTLTRETFDSANVVLTDDHDLEVSLFKSSAFDRVLGELGSPTKIMRIADPRLPIWRAAHPL